MALVEVFSLSLASEANLPSPLVFLASGLPVGVSMCPALHSPSAMVYYRLVRPSAGVVEVPSLVGLQPSHFHFGKLALLIAALSHFYRSCRDCPLCQWWSLDVQEVQLLV
jgi:hypothetical protein